MAARARTLLRRFAAVGVAVTALDVALLVALAAVGVPAALADALAIAAAALASWLLNRSLTFAADPAVRWVRRPATFAVVAALGAALDVAVLMAVLRVLPGSGTGVAQLLVAKAVSLAGASTGRFWAYRAVLFQEVHRGLSRRGGRPPPVGAVRLSVVIPAYEERDRIGATISRVRAELAEVAGHGGLEVVVVDDGSPDGTAQAAREGGADRVIVHPRNRGKGAAVRSGMLAASGATVAFTDADLSYAPAQIERLLAQIEDGWDVAVGSRRHTGTRTLVRARRLRELGGRVVNAFTHAVLLGAYRDTQCGLKAFRADVGRVVFERSRIDGFAFDVEVLHLVERYGLSLVEVPVEVANSERSTVKVLRDGARLLVDLTRILRLGRRGAYDLGPDERASAATGQVRGGTAAPAPRASGGEHPPAGRPLVAE
ncbi:MAG: glycosyltransferase [Actinobacteria bacterium]|nr:glycosyltransferase [Actinomycetota bacterium]